MLSSASAIPTCAVCAVAHRAGSYGSLARFTELRRIRRVGETTLVGASGEYSDFQYIMDLLQELVCVCTHAAARVDTILCRPLWLPTTALRTLYPPHSTTAPIRSTRSSLEEHCIDDGAKMGAREIHSYLTRVMYQRRNKMDPLWNTLLVAGVSKDGQRWVLSRG